jgi:hypothetical protein
MPPKSWGNPAILLPLDNGNETGYSNPSQTYRTLRSFQLVEDLSVQGAHILEEGKW